VIKSKVEQPGLFDAIQESSRASFWIMCKELGVSDGPNWADRFGQALHTWAASAIRGPIRTLSLFSGAGGLDIGFHDAGFTVETAVEIDERFAATLKGNAVSGGYLEGTKVLCGDIRDYHPTQTEQVDFLVGGPPCQTFSAAGRRAAGVQGTQDARGTLFQEYIRLLTLLKPRGFLFENVYGITGAEGGKAWETIRTGFEEAGYRIAYRILDAADYGVPQHRERMFIVGTRECLFLFPAPTHGPDSPEGVPFVTASAALDGAEVSEKELRAFVGGRFGALLKDIPEGLNYSFFTEKMGHPQPIFAWRSKFSDYLYKADPDTPVRTLKAQGGQYTGPFHWLNRPFAVSELKRLQTIPDRYRVIGSRQVAIHQIGNSVPPQLARILAIGILHQIFGVAPPSDLPLLMGDQQLGFRQRKRRLTAVYRSKASRAIAEAPAAGAGAAAPATHVYAARLTDDFALVSKPGGAPGGLFVRCALGRAEWRIRVDADALADLNSPSAFDVEVFGTPDRPWILGDCKVKLIGGSLTENVFVAVWKAFEEELKRQNVKADIIQLREYYQYPPRFRCRMTLFTPRRDPMWEVVEKVVEGRGVGEILTADELAHLWQIPFEEVLKHAMSLRSLGYEARNHWTNPQIANGSYLLPYAFPTLTPVSVQLRKSMVATDE
jgi:DNA (cytosine-5)-methyltransferase 1